MPTLRTMICAAAVAVVGVACGPALRLHTVVNPEANLTALRTFRMLPPPRVRPGVGVLPANDPMLLNSTTNVALRRALVQGFESRGYVTDDSTPDFVVAYYASAQETLDVMCWDYGYPWRPEWWRGWGTGHDRLATEYVEGTVIIDVLDGQGRELLWRGRGIAAVSGNVDEYIAELRRTVVAILNEFPAARPAVVAAVGRGPAR